MRPLTNNQKAFFLFRHGDTYETKNHLDYGKNIFSSPILPEAQKYLKKMGEYLKKQNLDFFASSDIVRCQQTAKIIEEIVKVPIFLDKRLTEFDPDSPYTPEPVNHFISRIQSFLSNIQQSEFKNIAICGHGSGIACLAHLIKYNRFSENEFLDYPPPGVLWIIKEKNLVEKDFR